MAKGQKYSAKRSKFRVGQLGARTYTHASSCTVTSMETGEVLRVEPARHYVPTKRSRRR